MNEEELKKFEEQLQKEYKEKVAKLRVDTDQIIASKSSESLGKSMNSIIKNTSNRIGYLKNSKKSIIKGRLIAIGVFLGGLTLSIGFAGALLPMSFALFGVAPALLTVGLINDVIMCNKEIDSLKKVIENAEKKKNGNFDVSEKAENKRKLWKNELAKNKISDLKKLKTNKRISNVVPVLGTIGTVLAAGTGLLIPALAAGGLTVALSQVVRSRGNAIENDIIDTDRKERKTDVGLNAIKTKRDVIEEEENLRTKKELKLQQDMKDKLEAYKKNIENKKEEEKKKAETKKQKEAEEKDRKVREAIYEMLMNKKGSEINDMFDQENGKKDSVSKENDSSKGYGK